MQDKVKVIYISGEGRSGSTLAERILGQHSEIVAAGELKHIWDRSFLENQLCSCGKPFRECEHWQKITQDPFYAAVDPHRQLRAQENICRLRHYFRLVEIAKGPGYESHEDLKEMLDTYYRLYRDILNTTGKAFVLDASKHPVFGLVLTMHPNIDVHVLHLVRDLRGVAYSWRKKKVRPEIVDRTELMPRYSVFRTAMSWNVVNTISEKLQNYAHAYHLQRYEDLVSTPRESLGKIFEWLKIADETDRIFTTDHKVNLQTDHTVAGNPMRFKTGEIPLKPDEAWRREMTPWDRATASLMGYRYLKKYGYFAS